MKKTLTALIVGLFVLGFSSLAFGQNAWINEIHYDNESTDVNEFVEIVIEDAGSYTLSDFTVTLYNGSNGESYGSETLDNFTEGITSGNFTIFYKSYPTNGIQNGPDGLALDYLGTVIQFLSYEGTFTATDGPANGMTSTDIEVEEVGSTPVGYSLQLSGNGTQYSEFTWQPPAPETPGNLNNGQSFGGPVPLTISNISREHTVPTSSQTCYVQCDITGGTPPYTAVIKYNVNGTPQADISMANTSGDTYQGTLPLQSDGARVEYYIEVTDNAKTTETSSTYGLFWGTSDISNAPGKIKEVDANGVLVYDGYYARVTGVATVASGVYSTSSLDVYLQDSYGGINIYKGGAGTVTITAGNSYTAVGVLDQYNGKAEITPDDASTDITDNGSGTMPSIEIITIAEYLADPEYYEGMLIGIQYLNEVSGTWGYNANLTMTDDGGTSQIILFVDGDTDLDDNPEPVWPKDVVGIASQYDSSSPYTEAYQIMPRAYSDIWESGTLPVTLLSFTATYASEYANGCVEIGWETASESDIRGFNIYRAADEDYLNAKPVNSEIIKPEGFTSQGAKYSFYDIGADVLTSWYYWLEVVNVGASNDVYGPITYQSIDFDDNGEQNIIATRLDGCYPNPVQRGYPVTFKFTLGGLEGESKHVELKVYNLRGELVEEVVSEKRSVKEYEEHWTPTNLANGIYFYQFKTDGFNEVKKFVVVQ